MNILLANIFGDCLIFETEVLSVCAMTFRLCASNLAFSRIQVVWVRILIRHVLAQPGGRKVEASAPWAVGSATRAWNFCGVHSVTKVENLWPRELRRDVPAGNVVVMAMRSTSTHERRVSDRLMLF